jgi:hypothetical protein
VIERVLVRLEALPGRCGWLIWLEFLAWLYCTNSDQAEISQIAHSVLNGKGIGERWKVKGKSNCMNSSNLEVLAMQSHHFKSVN